MAPFQLHQSFSSFQARRGAWFMGAALLQVSCFSYEGQQLHNDPLFHGSNTNEASGGTEPGVVGTGGMDSGTPPVAGATGGGSAVEGTGGEAPAGTGGSYEWMPPVQGTANYPSDMTDLSVWRLELPLLDFDGEGVQRVEWDELRDYEHTPYFFVNDEKTAVVFRTPVEAATTTGSGYPRTELREMSGSSKAGWAISSGRHVMEITQRIVAVPPEKPDVVAGQIHDDADDVIMIRYEGDSSNKLFVEANGADWGVLDSDYELGEWFTVRIIAEAGKVIVEYNGEVKVNRAAQCLDEDLNVGPYCYFKAGCYAQSNLAQGDKAGAIAEVEISSLTVTHE